jgi:hypothetical protein
MLVLAAMAGVASGASPVWRGGAGNWEDAARWGGTLPGVKETASIEGNSHVTLARGEVIAADVEVGSFRGSNAVLTVDGGTLSVDMLRVGELAGCSGRLALKSGGIVAGAIYIGGANTGSGGDRSCSGELEIHGGRVLARHLAFGWGGGSTAGLRVVGSKAAGIVVLDALWAGIRQKGVGGSEVAMAFEMDADGVTPITVLNKKAAISLVDAACQSDCRLRVALRDVPPAGDVALIRLNRPCNGTFTELPEGSIVRAEFGGAMYEWTLTYRGGDGGTDVALTKPRVVAADGRRILHTTGRAAKVFVVDRDEIRTAMQERFRKLEAQEPPLTEGPLAFPGAEGCGARARGGRGGKTLYVTNLDDSGPGSLREAVMAKGPRTVHFCVGGVIRLKSALVIQEPFLTINGQTAPGDGICIRADTDIRGDAVMLNKTHDIVLRYLRVQHGKGARDPGPDGGGDCIAAYDSDNFIVDHCSALWGTDETISVTGTSDRYTIQWCIIAEGLNYARHSMGTILGGGRSTWHHNLYAHCGTRNPRFAGQARCDFRNNVVYDWGFTAAYGEFALLNYAGNYLKPGPSTHQRPMRFIEGGSYVLPGSLHLAGNMLEGDDAVNRDNWLGADFDRECASASPFPMPATRGEPAEAAFKRVLAEAGATLPKRDAADTRIVSDVRNRTGKIIHSQEDVGGWPNYPATTAQR